jgi:hypothetical protein
VHRRNVCARSADIVNNNTKYKYSNFVLAIQPAADALLYSIILSYYHAMRRAQSSCVEFMVPAGNRTYVWMDDEIHCCFRVGDARTHS